ncbi:glycosyltransferase [Flavobacterium chuncheonense]|uniref:Glycosyltransferase n=1 Tax=Flavobacterium chuncheonense TaxID=2026653 RepID=A0ABW5YND8_9FLAO
MKRFSHDDNTENKTSFSIVVPFRNEVENLPKILHTISLLNYPKELFEVILVDDASDDNYKITHYDFSITLLNNQRKSGSPKKDAIEAAIQIAKHNWIITTDADCLVQKNWLSAIDQYIQQGNKKMVAAGVCYLPQRGLLHAFQNLDFMSLQGTTIGSFGIDKPFMCNGANFAYEKSFFEQLNGFEGNETIASGDDVFLLQKAILQNKKSVGYCMNPESIVATKSEDSWVKLFQQRIRWAAKSTSYSSTFGKILALIVFTSNLAWICVFLFWLIGQFDQNYFMLFTGSKFLIDYILLHQTASYFKTKLHWVFISSLLYPFFNTLVALNALLGNYTWKGRKFKR